MIVSDERAVYRVLQRTGNIVVPGAACRPLDGFVPDTCNVYRNPSIIRTRLHCTTRTLSFIGWGNTFPGSYHFAVAMQDASAGDEPLELWMDARKLADACARANDNRVHLLVVEERLELRGGERFRLVTGKNDRPYRIESIALLKRRPAACPRPEPRRLRLREPRRRTGIRSRRIPLAIQGCRGLFAKRFPLTTGIPLPIGHLYDPGRVELLDAFQNPIPVQVGVNGLWPDGSVRWLLVDFQHDVSAEDRAVTLRYGRDVARRTHGQSLAVEGRSGVRIDTGAAKLHVARDGLVLPGEVQLADGAKAVGPSSNGGIRLRTADGNDASSREVDRIEVVDAGPLRAVVRVTCRHFDSRGHSMFRSAAYVHAYAGKAWFRVSYTFTNDNTAAGFTDVRDLTLSTPLRSRPGRATSVLQDLDNHFTLSVDGQGEREGRRHSGLLVAETGAGTCAVAVRHLWQNYPKRLALGPEGIEVGICPDVSRVDYRVGGVEEERLFYHLVDGATRLKCGMSRTHDLFYGFGPRGSGADLRQQAGTFAQSPVVRADAGVYVRSGAVGQMARKSRATGFYEDWLDGARAKFIADRRRTRAYGMMNYGDWFGERRYNWGNLEYDTPWAFLVEFVRGGAAAWFELGVQAAQHLVDVDTRHASPGADAVGDQYAHCMGHVGGYYREGHREMAMAVRTSSVAHTWVDGLFLYHGLTGDPRALEAAKAVCDNLAGDVDEKTFDFSNCRNSGWLLIHLCAAYRATLERRYLDTAHVVAERVLERQRDSGGWERMMMPGHCYCDPPRHMGNAAFMVGVLMAGLKRYHQITGNPRVRRSVVRAAHYVIDSYWVAETRTFRYTNCPHIWVHASMNPQMIEGLGYAWRLSGSDSIGRVLVGAVERCFAATDSEILADRTMSVDVPGYPRREFSEADEGLGKTISLRMRQAPFALFDYEKIKAALGSGRS